MKPQHVCASSSELLDSMQIAAVVHVPKRVVFIVQVRLWCATQLIRLAGLIGGFEIAFTDDAEDDT